MKQKKISKWLTKKAVHKLSNALCTRLMKIFKKTPKIETVQDFLIKFEMKPCMGIVEISIFFTKSCNCQTYQNYEQSRQKLGTILENEVPQFRDFGSEG